MKISRSVLVVGDDEAVIKAFEQVFSGKGFAVATARSGEDALWTLDHDSYDAVFTALELRGLSGLELADEVHAEKPRLPVFIIAGTEPTTSQERAAAAATGVAGFLRKPLSPEQISATADQVLKVVESFAPLQPRTAEAKTASPSPTKVFVSRLRDIVLFLLAPIVGLIYILLFPVVGFGMLIWLGLTRVSAKREISEIAAPAPLSGHARPSILITVVKICGVALIGIAYGLVGPILGLGVLAWFFFEAWGKLGAEVIKPSET
ncbi:MAG: response regulator [Xanthobacteraceae bacterium]|jgi:CheY-like chemotaxis protein